MIDTYSDVCADTANIYWKMSSYNTYVSIAIFALGLCASCYMHSITVYVAGNMYKHAAIIPKCIC